MKNDAPFISVITPMLNEERYIGRFLESLVRQSYPAERYELLLADGGSSDGTLAVVRAFRQAHPEQTIRLWVWPRTGRERRLNLCGRLARGSLLARIDAHSVVAGDYLETVAQTFARAPVPRLGAVGGPVRTVAEGPLSQAIGLAMQSRFGMGCLDYRRPDFEGVVPTVQNASYSRAVFEAVGWFDEEIGCEDSDFHFRLGQAGYAIFITPRLQFHYFPRRTLIGLARQFLNYGRWRARFFRKHKSLPPFRYLLPPALVAGLAALPFCWLGPLGLKWLGGLGAGVYAATALGFAFRDGGKEGLRWVPLVLFLYPWMHLSYGLGMWREILHLAVSRFWGLRPAPEPRAEIPGEANAVGPAERASRGDFPAHWEKVR